MKDLTKWYRELLEIANPIPKSVREYLKLLNPEEELQKTIEKTEQQMQQSSKMFLTKEPPVLDPLCHLKRWLRDRPQFRRAELVLNDSGWAIECRENEKIVDTIALSRLLNFFIDNLELRTHLNQTNHN